MADTNTLDPFAAAVEVAQGEIAGEPAVESLEVQTQDSETEPEVLEDQVADEPDEQAEADEPPEDQSDEQSDELFADLEIDDVEDPVSTSISDLHELPGIDEPVTTQELRDGYLRQSDYTKKTQELALQRQAQEKAISFWDVFTQHPQEVARQLAVEAGLIEADAQPIKVVELPFRSEADIQAEVDRKVAEALESHPAILEARKSEGERWIASEFARIEKDNDVTLGQESRNKILVKAHRSGTDDLELVFQAMLAAQQRAASQRQALKDASPKRPTGTSSEATNVEHAKSYEEAVEMAMNEIAARRR